MTAGINSFGAGGAGGGFPGPSLPAPPLNDFAKSIQAKAGSKSSADLQEVGSSLTSPRDLLRLNAAREYAELPPEKIAVHAILIRLSRNPSERARAVIDTLCSSKEFLAEQARVECLLLTLPNIHPLPEKALPLLRRLVDPANENLEMAIHALFESGEKLALDIFAEQVIGGRHDAVLVQSWMRDPLLRHRRDPAVLEMCLELLPQPKLDAASKNSLVEALFDYRPSEWYQREAPPPKPPSSKSLARGARASLKKIVAAIAADPSISAKNKALAEKAGRGL